MNYFDLETNLARVTALDIQLDHALGGGAATDNQNEHLAARVAHDTARAELAAAEDAARAIGTVKACRSCIRAGLGTSVLLCSAHTRAQDRLQRAQARLAAATAALRTAAYAVRLAEDTSP